MKKILLAGATGYLGSYILPELLKRGYSVKALVRNLQKLKKGKDRNLQIVSGEITRPDSIAGCCAGIDCVISTVGITRQKDGLTYQDVDYQANLNLLEESVKSGVARFIYVSVLNGENLRHLKICAAKEAFVERLRQEDISACVLRPNGFFNDMEEYLRMARKGKVYLFGRGQLRANPIHGQDLAILCTDEIEGTREMIEAGGPEILTHRRIAELAFEALGTPPVISYIPEWVRTAALALVRTLTGSRTYGPIEFFLTVMAMDMIAPTCGSHTLEKFFRSRCRDTESCQSES